MRRLSILWVALGMPGAFALALPAAAYPITSARSEAPVARMASDDLALARACLRDALDDGADGIVHFWTNARTGASGTATSLRWFQRNGMDCRHVEVTFLGSLENSRNVWTLCQADEGWRLLGSS